MGALEAMDADAAGRVGRTLDEKWTLEQLVGVGGMAAVYRGRHRNGARAAVKILHAELAKSPSIRERFVREGYAANRVEHRGAVRVLDDDTVSDGPDAGASYLVMELLEGESLEDRSARAPRLDEAECLMIANAVLEVLEAAHEHGVVHRDLKPDNIFLARDPDDGTMRVKVLDFGLARLTESESTTQFGLALGTPSYMAPEQAAGRVKEIDGRTDLFAVGATVLRLLSGRRIHEETDVARLVLKMATEPAPPVRSIAPQISERTAAILDRALAFEREDRYPTAAAMRADVQAARGSTSTETTETKPARPRRSMIAPVTVAFYVALLAGHFATSADAAPQPAPIVASESTPALPDAGVAQASRAASPARSAAHARIIMKPPTAPPRASAQAPPKSR